MAAMAVDPPPERLSSESIPVVDLRLLSLSELTALSRCSSHSFDLHRCDDVVIPKIDRAVFNESAGSRKQTYSRLRLAPRKPDISHKPQPVARTEPVPDDAERAENAKIISLFKQLFNSDSQSGELVPINVEYSQTVPGLSVAAVPISVVYNEGGERKRKRGRKPKSDILGFTAGGGAVAMNGKGAMVIHENADEKEKEIVNKNGMEVDLVELAKLEDPYGAQIRRRTQGLERDEELLGFMTSLNGQWGSRRKRRKIVDANEFGDALPNGWKVLIGMKKKQGQAWLFCRRYISVLCMLIELVECVLVYSCQVMGRHVVDVRNLRKVEWVEATVNRVILAMIFQAITQPHGGSAYGHGCWSHQEGYEVWSNMWYGGGGLRVHWFSLHCNVKYLVVSNWRVQDANCTNSNNFTETTPVVNKSVSEPDEDMPLKVGNPSLSITSQANTRDKQLPLLENVNSGNVKTADIFKCHKCSTAFSNKDGLLHHLLSCHKRKRRKAGDPIEDDVLMRDGKYECQFCQKAFYERNSYFGHVGIHVKTYVKHIGGSPGIAAKQQSDGPISTGVIPPSVIKMQGTAEMNGDSALGTPVVTTSSELNIGPPQSKLQAGSDLKTSDSCDAHLGNVSSSSKQIVKNAGTGKTLAEQSFSEGDAICRMTDNEPSTVDVATDMCAGKLESASGAEKVIPPNDKSVDIGKISEETDITKNTDSAISDNMIGLVGNAESDLPLGSEQTTDRINANGVSTGVKMDATDGIASSDNFRSNNIKLSLSTENFEIGLSEDNVGQGMCNNGIRPESNADLTVGAGNGINVGADMNNVTDVQHKGSSEGCSAVPQVEEEMCEVADNVNGVVESLAESELDGGSEPNKFSPQVNQQSCGVKDFVENLSPGCGKEVHLEMLSSGTHEAAAEVDSCGTKERNTESSIFLLSGNIATSCIENVTFTVSEGTMLEPRGEEGSKSNSFPPCIFQDNKTCAVNTLNDISTRKTEVPKSDMGSSIDMLFTSGNSNICLGTNSVTNTGIEKISAPLGSSQPLTDESNLFGTCSSMTEESQQERDSKSLFSCLSVSDDMHLVTDQVHSATDVQDAANNVNDASAATSTGQLPKLNKLGNSRAKKVILDFHTDVAEPNTSVPTSVQHETIPQGSSPFSLWNEQSYRIEHNQTRVYDGTRQEASQGRVPLSSSLSLTSLQQTYDVGYNLNNSYMGTVDELSRFDAFNHPRDTDLMIGFRNNDDRPNQNLTEVLWRSNDGTVMPSGLGDSSSSRGQVPSTFRSFDIVTNKGENELYSVNEKFDGLSSFEGLRSAAAEPMEFSFLTGHDSSAPLEEPKVLSYDNAEMEQGFGSSLWLGKGNTLPNIPNSDVVTIVCVWCGNEFHQDSVDSEMQAGSIGYLCPTCKARISGQFF
ncbi:methyl-CpG-binding domain-containing protein [Ancistrocladus abbreviatus]